MGTEMTIHIIYSSSKLDLLKKIFYKLSPVDEFLLILKFKEKIPKEIKEILIKQKGKFGYDNKYDPYYDGKKLTFTFDKFNHKKLGKILRLLENTNRHKYEIEINPIFYLSNELISFYDATINENEIIFCKKSYFEWSKYGNLITALDPIWGYYDHDGDTTLFFNCKNQSAVIKNLKKFGIKYNSVNSKSNFNIVEIHTEYFGSGYFEQEKEQDYIKILADILTKENLESDDITIINAFKLLRKKDPEYSERTWFLKTIRDFINISNTKAYLDITIGLLKKTDNESLYYKALDKIKSLNLPSKDVFIFYRELFEAAWSKEKSRICDVLKKELFNLLPIIFEQENSAFFWIYDTKNNRDLKLNEIYTDKEINHIRNKLSESKQVKFIFNYLKTTESELLYLAEKYPKEFFDNQYILDGKWSWERLLKFYRNNLEKLNKANKEGLIKSIHSLGGSGVSTDIEKFYKSHELEKIELLAKIVTSEIECFNLIEKAWDYKLRFAIRYKIFCRRIDKILNKKCPKHLLEIRDALKMNPPDLEKILHIRKITKDEEIRSKIMDLASRVVGVYKDKINCSFILTKHKDLMSEFRMWNIEHCIIQFINENKMKDVVKFFKLLIKKYPKWGFKYSQTEDFLRILDKTNKPFTEFIMSDFLDEQEKIDAFEMYNLNKSVKDKKTYLNFVLENLDKIDYHIFTYFGFEYYIKPQINFTTNIENKLEQKCRRRLKKNPFNKWLNLYT